MRRAPLLALLVASVAAACGETEGDSCPGEAVAFFTFSGDKVPKGDPALDGLDPVPSVPDCPAEVGHPATLPPFQATLASDPATQAAALCRPNGVVLYGLRSGSRFSVETGTGGAVLGGCSATCSAALRLVVAGDVVTGPGGEPASFQGALVETMTFVAGDCGTCLSEAAPSCAARYTLTGTPD